MDMKRKNATLKALQANEPTLGMWISSMSKRIVEMVGTCELDWIVIDMEHTPIGPARVENLIRTAESRWLTPVVRIPSVDSGLQGSCKRALDSGAQGVIVPRVETPEQAERVVNACLYPPDGERGVGNVRANEYGEFFDEYTAEANDETLVMVQLETKSAVSEMSKIVAVEGIDGVFVGEHDLAATYGHPGRKMWPCVQKAVDEILAIALQNNVYPGIVAPTAEHARQRINQGFLFVSVGNDLRCLGEYLDKFVDKF